MEDITDWTFDETTDLFANLDNIAESNHHTRLSPMLPEEVFWKKLQDSLANARSLDQIIDKLQMHLEGDFYHVYQLGSHCMKLDADMKQAVESKVVSIRLSTPRKLRSDSRKRLHPDRTSVTTARSSPATPVGPPARRRKGFKEDWVDKFEQPTASQDSPRGRSKLTSELPDTSTADTEEGPEICQSFETCSEGRSDGSRNLNPVPNFQASSESFIYANAPKRLQIIDYDTLDPTQRTCEQPVQDCSHETLQDILHDNMYFREKVAELTEIQKSLDQQVRVLQSKLRVRNGELGSQTVDPLKILCNRIVDLERRFNDRQEFLDPCLKSETENHHPPSMSKQMKQIESGFYNMSRKLQSLSTRKEFRYPQTDHLQQESIKDLGELLGRVFGDVQPSALLPHLRSQVSVGDLVQAIVGAAACEWVFESHLQCTTMMKTPLLEACRSHLSTIPGGEAAFQSLYFAALQLVVSGEHFRTVFVPRTATKLANRLVGALGPFIKTNRRHQSVIPIKRDLESIFQHALEVKTQVIAGKYMFGTIWPSRGTAYEERLMRTQSAESVQSHGEMSNCAPMKVKLPLVPGLRFYSHEKKFVDYCSFVKGDESDLGKSKVFCEAVVAIEI